MPSASRSRLTVERSSTRKHDALAKLRRQSRDAQIDRAAGDVFLNAAVLRQAALGDVHVRHHFDARNDRQREMARRRRHFVKRAIDAVANFEFVLERLEMDVARPVLDRLIQDQIDEANDRRGVRFGFDTRPVALVAAQRHQLARFAELLEDVLHAGGVGAVVALDPIFDLLGRRDDDMDVFAEREAEIFRRAQIERIDQRDARARCPRRRSAARDGGGRDRRESIVESAAINLALGKIDEFRPERVGDDSIESALIDEAAIDHRLCDRFSVQRCASCRDVVGLRRLQDVLLDERDRRLVVVRSSSG